MQIIRKSWFWTNFAKICASRFLGSNCSKNRKKWFCSPLPKYSQTRFRTLAKKALKKWFLLTQANFYILDLLLRHLQIFDFLLKYLQTIRILLTKTFVTLSRVTTARYCQHLHQISHLKIFQFLRFFLSFLQTVAYNFANFYRCSRNHIYTLFTP